MGISVCPVVVIAAPIESVWALLSDPALYDRWWDAHTQRIVPEGMASRGQTLYAKTSALGRQWNVLLRVEMVHAEQHQIRLYSTLPLGIANRQTITCTPIDPTSTRLQFG